MPEQNPLPDIVHGVPPIAVSSASTRLNRTGSWKYIRPMYQDKVAPCNQGCPIGIDVEGYMNLVREGKLEEAVDLLLRENPLPSVTGRICYHPCEKACNRAEFDQAVSIHAVERMLGDLALEQPLPPPVPHTRNESVGIIGAGPAGLACAFHLARLGYAVTVYEAQPEPGGVLRYGVPEYRLPKRVLAHEIQRIQALGVEIRCNVRVGEGVPFDEIQKHAAVFVATGAHQDRSLGIEGENLDGVRRGREFLDEVNRGARPSLGRRVVVVGGDATAVDCARAAVRLGAEVHVLCACSRADLPAHADEVEQAICEGVRFEFLSRPLAVLGGAPTSEVGALDGVEASFGEFDGPTRAARVTGVRCGRLVPGEADATGHRLGAPVAGSDFYLEADGVVVAIGEDPDLGFLPESIDHGPAAVLANPLGRTSRSTVYAGGDIVGAPRTVAYAIGTGKRAAIGIDHALRLAAGETSDSVDVGQLRLGSEGNLSMTRWRGDDPVARVNPENDVVRYDQLNVAHFTHVPRFRDRYMPAEWTRRTFEELNLGLTREDAVAEARRCFNCGVCNSCEVCLIFCPDAAITRRSDGRFQISYKYCKGCGVCAAECPRCAMAMTREGV
jgi:2-oxoacid:acceptor oxidoreductase delta subunit (pyruvate/2-ketoisovalerate family)